MAGRRAPVAEDREMHRRLVQPGKLQPGIEAGTLAVIALQRFPVAAHEVLAHRHAGLRRLDQDEAPRLAEPDRRGKAGEIQEMAQDGGVGTVAAEAPDVAPPAQQAFEVVPEGRVEGRSPGRCFFRGCADVGAHAAARMPASRMRVSTWSANRAKFASKRRATSAAIRS